MRAQTLLKVTSFIVTYALFDLALRSGATPLVAASAALLLLDVALLLFGRTLTPLLVNNVLAKVAGISFRVGDYRVFDRYAILDAGDKVALVSILQLRVLLPVEVKQVRDLAVVTTSYAKLVRQLPEGAKYVISKLPTDVADVANRLYRALMNVNYAMDYKGREKRGVAGNIAIFIQQLLHPEMSGSVEQLRERARELQSMLRATMRQPPVENVTYVAVTTVREKIRGLDPRREHMLRLEHVKSILLGQPDIEVIEVKGFKLAEFLFGEMFGHDVWAKGRGEVSSYSNTWMVLPVIPLLVATIWLVRQPLTPVTAAALLVMGVAVTVFSVFFDMPLLGRFLGKQRYRVSVRRRGEDTLVAVAGEDMAALHLILRAQPRREVEDAGETELAKIMRAINSVLYGVEGNVSFVATVARPAVETWIRELQREIAELSGKSDQASLRRRQELESDLERLQRMREHGKMVFSTIILTERVRNHNVEDALRRLDEKKKVVVQALRGAYFNIEPVRYEEAAAVLSSGAFTRVALEMYRRLEGK